MSHRRALSHIDFSDFSPQPARNTTFERFTVRPTCLETAWNCHLKSKCVEMWDTDSLGSLGSPTPEVRPAENASPARSHAAALFFGSGVQQDGFGTGSGRVHCQVHRVLASLSLWLSFGYSASVGPGALATRGATTRGAAALEAGIAARA